MRTLSLFVLLTPILLAQKPVNSGDSDWTLTFADEFNSTQLDLSRWIPHDPAQPAHSEVPEAGTLAGGHLHLTGTISTFGIFAQMFGRFEIRFRPTPTAQAFLLPVPAGSLPRIDLFRLAGPDKISFMNWWGSEQTERSFGDSFTLTDMSKGSHVVVLEWDRDHISWFLDGKKTLESRDGVPLQPMYLVIRQTAVPLDVDYVRIYQSASKVK